MQQQELPILHPLLQHRFCSGTRCWCGISVPPRSQCSAAEQGLGSPQHKLSSTMLKLLHHMDLWFCLLIIQFITSMAVINCHQKRASTSCALRLILTTWDWFSDPPKKKYPLLFPKLIQFLWTIFCSSFVTISQEASCWLLGLNDFKLWFSRLV